MKFSTLFSLLLLIIVTGGLVLTNPDIKAYEDYAGKQLDRYFTEEICDDLPSGTGDLFAEKCADIIQTLQPKILMLVQDRTDRLNLAVASIYRTSLGIPELAFLPRYEIETVGVLGRFFTYRALQVN